MLGYRFYNRYLGVAATTAITVVAALLVSVTPCAQAEAWGPLSEELHAVERQTRPMLTDLHPREILSEERPHLSGSLSYGNTSHGSLRDAKHLPDRGPYHYVLREHLSRPTHWGSDELVDGLLRAAQTVVDTHGSGRTGIGNISLKDGGDISWSVSHNTGRDADVAFFFVDPAGKAIEVPTLIHVGPDGLQARGYPYSLDVPRSWTFVESLVRDQAMRVQWIFVSEPIRQRLLRYAEEQGVDADIVAFAADVLRQPMNALPHDDHFHVRVHCAFEDRVDGCVEWGPRREHLSYNDAAMERRVASLLKGVLHEDEALAEASLRFLQELEPREAVHVLLATAEMVAVDQRLPLLQLAAQQGGFDVAQRFLHYLDTDIPEEHQLLLLRSLGGLALEDTAEPLVNIALDDRRSLHVRVGAVRALQAMMIPTTLVHLAPLLKDQAEELRLIAHHVLNRLTLFELNPEAEPSWETWEQWKSRREDDTEERLPWLLKAFEKVGYDIGTAEEPNFPELLRALGDAHPALAWNADRILVKWTGIYSSAHRFDSTQKQRFWRRALRRL